MLIPVSSPLGKYIHIQKSIPVLDPYLQLAVRTYKALILGVVASVPSLLEVTIASKKKQDHAFNRF